MAGIFVAVRDRDPRFVGKVPRSGGTEPNEPTRERGVHRKPIAGGLFRRSIPLVLLIVATASFGGCTNHGRYSLAQPSVLGDAQTRAALARQGTRIGAALAPIDASRAQALMNRSYASDFRLRGAFEQLPTLDADGDPVADTASPTVPDAPGPVTLPATLAPSSVPAPAPLLSEVLRDLQAKEAHIEGVRLLYEGDAAFWGPHARIYLVKFDVFVEPERQHYLNYLWRWLAPSHGFRNYTKDYLAEVHFVLPDLRNPDDGMPLLYVYAVQPSNENLAVLESTASQVSMQAALAARAPEGALQAEYADALMWQYLEQRKFPLVQGVVDAPNHFHAILSPRQRVRQKAWNLPWTSRFTIERRLEPELRSVYAYLLVTDIAKLSRGSRRADLAGALRKQADQSIRLFEELKGGKASSATAMDLLQESPVQEATAFQSVNSGRLEIPVISFAFFQKFGKPQTRSFIPRTLPSARCCGADDERDPFWINSIALPLAPDRKRNAVPIVRSLGGSLFTISWSGRTLRHDCHQQACQTIWAWVLDDAGNEAKEPATWVGFDDATRSDVVLVTATKGKAVRFDFTPHGSRRAVHTGRVELSDKSTKASPVVKVDPPLGTPGSTVRVTISGVQIAGLAPGKAPAVLELSFGNQTAQVLDEPKLKPDDAVAAGAWKWSGQALLPASLESSRLGVLVRLAWEDSQGQSKTKLVPAEIPFQVVDLPNP